MLYVSLALFLLFIIGGPFLFLRFFSKLSGVDMVKAMAWGFKNKRFELVLNWGMCYLIGSVFLLGLLQQPLMQATMNFSHEGGLLGYTIDDENAELYDPARMEYITRRILPPPPVATSFNDTFAVIAAYRPFLSDDYQNIELHNIFLQLFFIFLAWLGLGLTYLVSHALANAYQANMHPPRKITHRQLADRFLEITGYRLSLVLTGGTLLIVLSSFFGNYLANRITRGYEEQYAPVRDEFRDRIMAAVAPGQVIKGRVVRRMLDYEKIYADSQSSFHNESDQTVSTSTYTFEFRGLIPETPVYLGITYLGNSENNNNIRILDQYFPKRESIWNDVILADPGMMQPTVEKELEFMVDEDYGITLLTEGERPKLPEAGGIGPEIGYH